MDLEVAGGVEKLELGEVGTPPVTDTKALGILGVDVGGDETTSRRETGAPRHDEVLPLRKKVRKRKREIITHFGEYRERTFQHSDFNICVWHHLRQLLIIIKEAYSIPRLKEINCLVF